MEKFCPSKLPWKQSVPTLPKGKFCTLEQSFLVFLEVKFVKKVKNKWYYDIIGEDVIDCAVIKSDTRQIIASRDSTRRCLGAWLCFCKRQCRKKREQQKDLRERQSFTHLFCFLSVFSNKVYFWRKINWSENQNKDGGDLSFSLSFSKK